MPTSTTLKKTLAATKATGAATGGEAGEQQQQQQQNNNRARRSANTPTPPVRQHNSSSSKNNTNNNNFRFNSSQKHSQKAQEAREYFPTPETVASKMVADFYQWPVFFAVLPPLLTLVYGGRVEEWSEGFMLIIIAFYLYGLVKVPWELYVAARINHVHINSVADLYAKGDLSPGSEPEQLRQASVWRLWMLEWIYFIGVFLSPLGGAVFLRYIRPHLHLYQNLINDFPMALYVLTAYIRPLIHLFRLFKQQIAELQSEVQYPVLEMQELRQRVSYLENNLSALMDEMDQVREETRREFKDALEPNIKVLNKDLRKTSRREQKFIDYSIARFRDLELRLQEQEVAILHSISSSPNNSSSTSRSSSISRWIWESTPVNLAFRVSTWFIPSSVKNLLFNAMGGGGQQKQTPPHLSITDGIKSPSRSVSPVLSPTAAGVYPWDFDSAASQKIPPTI